MQIRSSNRMTVMIAKLAAIGLVLAGLVKLASAEHACGQSGRPRLQNPAVRRNLPPPAPGVGAANTTDIQRARQILGLYLQNGQKQPYVGTQTTQIRGTESQQIVKHLGPGRERTEYLSPAGMRGGIMLMNGGRLLNYVPSESIIHDGAASLEEFSKNGRTLMQAIRQGRILVNVVGNDMIAGQNATIVEIRPARPEAFYKRLWIDNITGVRLKIEDRNPQGVVISTTYFTSIDYTAKMDPREFQPGALPNVPHVPQLPTQPPLPDIATAQQQVAYTIRQPTMPQSYRLKGVWVDTAPGGRKITILEYSDGVNIIVLYERPLGPNQIGKQTPLKVRQRNGVATWPAGGLLFTLIGNMKPENLQRVVDSLR